MQSDMHFYGTYVLTRAAGISKDDAGVIAYAAQFVDDSTKTDSQTHKDGGLLYGTATVHSKMQAVTNANVDRLEQRRVWVPFHFLPGGQGDTLEERLLCVKNSDIANSMLTHHIETAANGQCKFALELVGVAAHVYMDTFSHYGFSGISSSLNSVDGDTCVPIDVCDPDMEAYVLSKKARFGAKYTPSNRISFLADVLSKIARFGAKYTPFNIISFLAEASTGSLGHGGVATFPDRPFLHWKVEFEQARPGNGRLADRNNPSDYIEACERMHAYFVNFARNYYDTGESPKEFGYISERINEILRFEGGKEARIKKWLGAISDKSIYDSDEDECNIRFDPNDWENDKAEFHNHNTSEKGISGHAYKFHQAAALHRHYVLKELLPEHGIAVY